MKVGIMQPYFVPYIGYWQLMNAVDKYVIYDDVNFIKSGWINRNRILLNQETKYLNIPMIGASSFKLINEVEINQDQKLIKKTIRTIENAYSKAPYYKIVSPMIAEILNCGKNNLASYITKSFEIICDYLEIHTELILSSTLAKDNNLRSQDKVIAICKLLGGKEYYNAIGGKNLYEKKSFEREGIQLNFLETNEIVYQQFNHEFIPNLSIIDVMMFNDKETIKKMLTMFKLV